MAIPAHLLPPKPAPTPVPEPVVETPVPTSESIPVKPAAPKTKAAAKKKKTGDIEAKSSEIQAGVNVLKDQPELEIDFPEATAIIDTPTSAPTSVGEVHSYSLLICMSVIIMIAFIGSSLFSRSKKKGGESAPVLYGIPIQQEEISSSPKKRNSLKHRDMGRQGILEQVQSCTSQVRQHQSAEDKNLPVMTSEGIEDPFLVSPPVHVVSPVEPISIVQQKPALIHNDLSIQLKKWQTRKRDEVEIGAFYERYCAYLLWCDGYRVKMHGILKGKDDHGIDLIAKKGSHTLIVQAKCWSKMKVIRENTIMQLSGSVILYAQAHPKEQCKAVIYTSTLLSEEAQKAANALGVEVREGVSLKKDFPMIKLNSSTGKKVVHYPWEAAYDLVESPDQYVQSPEETTGYQRYQRG